MVVYGSQCWVKLALCVLKMALKDCIRKVQEVKEKGYSFD